MVEITIVLEKDIYSSIDLRLTDITGGSIEKIDETLCMYALD